MFVMRHYYNEQEAKEIAYNLGACVLLKCECNRLPLKLRVPVDYFEKVTEQYCILKDGISITCPYCGKVQTSDDDKYIPYDNTSLRTIPKCPACNSYKIEKISMSSKIINFAVVGVFSSSVGKTFYCKNCGYKF